MVSDLKPKELDGLDEAEAGQRLQRDGANELPSRQSHGLLAIVVEVIREPMLLMLGAAGAMYLLLGEATDAAMLLGFVFVVMGITIVQARRTASALDALRDLSSPRALVIRNGKRRRIAGRDVVAGDLIVVAEGDRIPADGLLRQTSHLTIDESLLTGESGAVRKVPNPQAIALDRPGGDDLPSVFSGTLVTSGQGIIEVLATGPRTELGQIGHVLAQTQPEPTLLQTETKRTVRRLAIASVATCLVAVLIFAWTRGGSLDAWKHGFLAGVAMAMAILPEEFPVVLTIFLALGAWRLARIRVLTRRMPAVEMLGAATVLCVDKTGTLTQNTMTLRTLAITGSSLDLCETPPQGAEPFHELLEHAILASKPDPFDPMERALHAAGGQLLPNSEHLHPGWALVREYPLSQGLLAVSQAWQTGVEQEISLSAKGAPEAVADLCHLPADPLAAIAKDVEALAGRGLRVLGVARGRTDAAKLAEQHHDLQLSWIGLLGFEDPLRPTVASAVAECHTAGVRVVMITGDYPATARRIAEQAGIIGDIGTVLTGTELDALSDAELAARVCTIDVFARVLPQQKLRIVNALKSRNEIVAMTGDGVNDAPALKAAHIGIAMGGRGTDVAREAASLVLLDDDFSSIVQAVKLGRRIYDNISKAVVFITAVHVPIAGLSMLPVFFADWPLLLLPVHIAFMQLIIDPSCTLIFEAEPAESGVMHRPPRRHDATLFSWPTMRLALLQGLGILAVCVAVLLLARRHHPIDAARALTFVTLVVSFVLVILINRSRVQSAFAMLRAPNAAVRWVLLAVPVFLGVAVTVPLAQNLFHFKSLHLDDLLLSLGAALSPGLWYEAVKWRRRRRKLT